MRAHRGECGAAVALFDGGKNLVVKVLCG